jgi:replicative DNA helicase Mcm
MRGLTRKSALSCVGAGWSKLINNLYDAKPKDVVVIQVKEKYGCYDDKTEILTEDGWKYFKDISGNDKVATLRDGEYLEYCRPSYIYEYDYDGEMYELETRGVSLLVTPNHKLYVAPPDKKNGRHTPYLRTAQNFRLENYENLYLKNKKFKKNATWAGEEKETITIPGYQYTNFMALNNKNRTYVVADKTYKMDDFLDFLGWYVSEGCANKNGNISIACCNTDGGKERKVISECLQKLGFSIKTHLEERSAIIFRIYNKQLAQWLLENCGHLAHNKKAPSFIQNLSPRQIRIFLNSLYAGDGHKTKTAHVLTTVSRQLSDDVQVLILKAGNTFRERKRKGKASKFLKHGGVTRDVYEINWMTKNYHNTMQRGLSRSSIERLRHYQGKVYCVEVPSHIIYVRRNGRGVWCGNSLRFYVSSAPDWYFDLIDHCEDMSSKICEVCGKPGYTREYKCWLDTFCDECNDKFIAARET